jgi:hypothetical protein
VGALREMLITYDLSEKSKENYTDIEDELEGLKAYHVQKSVWALKTDWTHKQVFDLLDSYFPEKDDKLLVIGVQTDNTSCISSHCDYNIRNLGN